MRVVTVDSDDDRLIDAIIALADAHRATLGFMPRAAFNERATVGTLIAVEDEDEDEDEDDPSVVAAYVLYDLPGNRIRLIHLCVAEHARGRGHAARLVGRVAKLHPNRSHIELRCRRDFPAHEMWPKLGFIPVGEAAGRSLEGLPLTKWRRRLRDEVSLFDVTSATEITKSLAVVDTNVFFDLTTPGRDVAESAALYSQAVTDEVEFVFTDELIREIDLSPDAAQRSQSRDAALRFRHLTVDSEQAARRYRALHAALGSPRLPDRSQRDLRHVAYAAAGGAAYLLTRDSWLRTRVAPVAEQLWQLTIASPTDLALDLDRQLRTGAYAPALLEQTDVRVEPVGPGQIERLAGVFVSHARGERRADLATVLRTLLAQPAHQRSAVASVEEQPVALLVWSEGEQDDQIAVARVAGRGGLGPTVMQQLLHQRRCDRRRLGGGRIVLTESAIQPALARALESEQFYAELDGTQVCRVVATALPTAHASVMVRQFAERLRDESLASIADRLDADDLTARQAADIERQLWPLKLTDSKIPTYLVPIRPVYAEALFDVGLAEQTLLHRQRSLGITREHVYYRAPGSPRFEQPARLLWYVSDERQRAGVKAVRAVSRLEEVVVGPPERLYERFRHLGVYELAHVRSAGRRGRAMALRFADTELLPRPIPVRRLAELAQGHGHTPVLVSASKIPKAVFAALYQEATRDDIQP